MDQLQIIQHNGRLLEGSKVTAKEFFGSMYDSYLNLHKAIDWFPRWISQNWGFKVTEAKNLNDTKAVRETCQ